MFKEPSSSFAPDILFVWIYENRFPPAGLTGYQSSCLRGLRELKLARNQISTLTSIQMQQLPGTNQSINQSSKQAINRWINYSIDESKFNRGINYSIDESIFNRSISYSIDRSTIQLISQLFNRSINYSIDQSIIQTINYLIDESIIQSIN